MALTIRREDLDAETIDLMRRYGSHDPWEPQIIEIEVFHEYEDKWPADDFIALIREAINKIPDGYRESAFVELTEYGSLYVKYRRPQTDEEISEYVMCAYEYSQRDRREYERLKRRFDPAKAGAEPPARRGVGG